MNIQDTNVDASYSPFLITNSNNITYVSSQFECLSGFKSEDILGKSFEELCNILRVTPKFSEQDKENSYLLFTESLDVKQVQITLESRDGQNIYTFKSMSNESLIDSFPIFGELQKSSAIGVALFYIPDIILLKANQKYLDFFEEPFNSMKNCIGRSIDKLVTEWKGSTFEAMWDKLVSSNNIYHIDEYRYDKLKKGITYWNITLIPISEYGKLKYCVEVAAEVTDMVKDRYKLEEQANLIEAQKKQLEIAENMTKNQKDYLYNIIDTLDLPILSLSYPEYNLIEINKKAKEFICSLDICHIKNPYDIKLGENILSLLPGLKLDEILMSISKMEQTKTSVFINKQCFTKNGEKAYLKITFHPLLNSNGQIAELLLIAVDITHEVEENLSLEKILKMQEEFFSYISHEFKTPLTVIYSAVQALEFLCGSELSDTAHNYIKKIRQAALQQIRLVNNLLDITRADAGYLKIHKRNTDIIKVTKAIMESVRPFASEKGVNLNFYSHSSKKIVALDDEKYERILLNLLSNAIKFTPRGKNILIKLSSRDGFIHLKVSDEGVGIPKDKQSIIFDRFGQVNNELTRKAEGTGIGLNLVKLLVNSMGGKIQLDSHVGKGSTFTVYLPDTTNCENENSIPAAQVFEDSLVQTVNIEFSNIYIE